MQRNKDQTRQRLIDAVSALVERSGFHSLGINAVARQAGVDKVLIYRYFGGLDGLILEFIRQQDFFSHLEAFAAERKLESAGDVFDLSRELFIAQLRAMRGNRLLQEILLWELSTDNEITQTIARTREEQGSRLVQRLQHISGSDQTDLAAIGNLIIGGIIYLILRARTVETYSGVELRSEEGWQRMEKAIGQVMDALRPQN
ncbi:TetR/AcrR family transcriptional regulator [candidate division KSB1 bacterium]|nr:TetR/AcrR family transcriptional regulator [candidate division KSB1 bacterium]